MSTHCVYSSSPDSCDKRFCGTEEECEQWIKDNEYRFPSFVRLTIQPAEESARWNRDFDIHSGSIYEQMNEIDDELSLDEKYDARTYWIRRELVRETEKAVGLRIKRIDGVLLPTIVYFPKSQCTIVKNLDGSYTVTIPLWLLKTKLPNGEQIFVG